MITVEQLIAAVETINSSGLDAEEWAAIAQPKKEALIRTALCDANTRIPVSVLDYAESDGAENNPAVMAVALQSIHLSRHYNDSASAGARAIASESVDGLSVTYDSSSRQDDALFGLRALAYLNIAKRRMRANIRFSRG